MNLLLSIELSREGPFHPALLCALVLAISVGAGCSDPTPPASRFPPDGQPGASPVWAIVDQLEFGRLIFYPVPLADWRDLVDLSLFDGFHPGMTFRAAEGEFGSPDRKGDDYLGPYWDYERPLGTVRISHKLKGSLPFLRWWRLEGFPEASDLEQLLHPNVVKHIPEDLERLTVVIMNNEGAPGGFVQVRKNKITSIDWVNNEGSGGTRDAS